MKFEDEVYESFKDAKQYNGRILTFLGLGKEFIENIKKNYLINYYIRVKDSIKRFNDYLASKNLEKESIDKITVRDVQLYLNTFESYKKTKPGYVILKRPLPDFIKYRELEKNKILNRCLCYDLRKKNKKINKDKAIKKCNYYNIEFKQYFEEVEENIQRYSTETIKGYRRVLRTIFNEAVRYEWITKNPVCQTKIGAGGGKHITKTHS